MSTQVLSNIYWFIYLCTCIVYLIHSISVNSTFLGIWCGILAKIKALFYVLMDHKIQCKLSKRWHAKWSCCHQVRQVSFLLILWIPHTWTQTSCQREWFIEVVKLVTCFLIVVL